MPPSHLIPRRRFRYGQFEMNLIGEAGRTYRIEFSSELSSWTKLADVANSTGTLSVIDPDAGKHGQRFYRATFGRTTRILWVGASGLFCCLDICDRHILRPDEC